MRVLGKDEVEGSNPSRGLVYFLVSIVKAYSDVKFELTPYVYHEVDIYP